MRSVLCTLLAVCLSATTVAALPTGLTETLRPLDGVVIKLGDGECLLDLGTKNGASEGDLVAVLAPGEELRHPVTGAVIGRLEGVKGLLRIVRVQPDFSWARRLDDGTIRPADPVRRFGEIPALFIDRRGDGHPLFNELQQALPHLAWRPWGEAALTGPGLRFILDGPTLTLRDNRDVFLGSWPIPVAGIPTPAPSPAATPVATGTLTPVEVKFPGKISGLAVADWDSDGRPEVAVAYDDRLEIGRLQGANWTAIAQIDLPGAVKALTLDGADLDGDGRPELLVTAVRGNRLASQIWGYDDRDYRLRAKDSPWFWRVITLPNEGPVALAQASDLLTGQGYSGQPFRVAWRDGKPEAGPPQADFAAATLHGSQPFVTPHGTFWAWLDGDDHLTVFNAESEVLWKGKDYFGGGESFIEWKAKHSRDEIRRLYLRSRLALNDGLLLVPQNQGGRTMRNARSIDKSRLVALRWNGLELVEVWSSPLRDGSLADFVVADLDGDGRDDYLLAGSLAGGLFDKARSALFLWHR